MDNWAQLKKQLFVPVFFSPLVSKVNGKTQLQGWSQDCTTHGSVQCREKRNMTNWMLKRV
jgi:hypothetical protein